MYITRLTNYLSNTLLFEKIRASNLRISNLILGCLNVVLTVVITTLAVQSARKCLLRSPTVLILPKVIKHLLGAVRVTLAIFRRANCILDDATLIFFALLAGLMRNLRVRG